MASLTNHTSILTKAGGASAGTTPPHDSLSAALARATNPGDEVVYFGEASKYESLIQANGALPVKVQTDAPNLGLDLAALVRAITPRTRAVLVARGAAAGESLPKATMAMLTRLLATAQNIYGNQVSLVTEEASERLSPAQSRSIAPLYTYAGASSSGYQPVA